MDVKKIILNAFEDGKIQGKSMTQISSALRLGSSRKKEVRNALKQLCATGKIVRNPADCTYSTPEKLGAFYATVYANPQGFAFLTPDGKAVRENDFYVRKRRLNGALDGDRVWAVPIRGTEDEACVLRVLKRGKHFIVGRVEYAAKCAYVIPDDRAFASDVAVPYPLFDGAQDGDKVVVEITNYPKNGALTGRICEVLGRAGDLDCEELAIIRSNGLREDFPDGVEDEAARVAAQKIDPRGLKDFRDILTVTIDGADTRDIDDAVSLTVKDGKYILGVHIADVSRYVALDGCLDAEAYRRGTSVYFPDRVLPMLPKELSNGACSLNAGEDRYALSCVMTFDDKGVKLKSELYESVIRSDRQMTYDEVTSIIEGEAGGRPEYAEIAPMLKDMARLCLCLEERRKENGEVTLDVKEAHIYLDERGKIVIPEYKRALSHRLIEQFMIAANESVAELAESKKLPFLYRVHEKPTEEKAELLYGFVKDLGLQAKGAADSATPRDYQKILNQAADKPFASVVNKVMLRSMQKARYCEENLGHFGLASECYCHFTSPIRRYPDLFVHRVLRHILRGEEDVARERFSERAQSSAIDTSERERRAETAERDVDDLYKLFYMKERIGEEYDAVISGVTENGIYAELPNSVEGMVRFDALPYDRYEYYPEKFTLKGARHCFKLGDAIKIKVAGCDVSSRRVQFVLA